jgi:hypothetical protein
LSALLLEEDVPPDQIATILTYENADGCDSVADGGLVDTFELRPIWAVFLAASNGCGHPLSFRSLVARRGGSRLPPYRGFLEETTKSTELSLPLVPIPPGGTVVIPLAVVVGPFGDPDVTILREEKTELDGYEIQVAAHVDMGSVASRAHLIGRSTWPTSFRLLDGSREISQEIHPFDLTNLYRIDRDFQCGCCPHVFLFTSDSASSRYLGEMFARQAWEPQTFSLEVPPGAVGLMICELEDESTHVNWLRVNGEMIATDLRLDRGDSLRFAVSAGDLVSAVGFYSPLGFQSQVTPSPLYRNAIVARFLRGAI